MNPVEIEIEDFGQGADQQGFGQAGDADKQAMAAGEQRDQDFLDHLILADDDLADLVEHPVPLGRELFDLGDLLLLDLCGFHDCPSYCSVGAAEPIERSFGETSLFMLAERGVRIAE